ncbi:MAG TPA: ATP-binding protein [Desulfobacterales bacterium]|jgi:two-component system, NtrC family, sensor kinase|nr:ATP-binding protein [Desulfobacterales bacterium]
MKRETTIEDLVGLGHTKLGFFKEVQIKIGELRAFNLELEAKRQEIQSILDGITDIVADVSLDFRIRTVNQSFFKLFPIATPRDTLCYRTFRNRTGPCPECPLLEARRTNQACRQTVILPVSGKNRQFEITASPLRDARGNPASILIVKRDVTLEKEYQAKFYHAEKMATIGLLAAGVAHEINNPLAAISGFAEGLKRRLPRLQAALGEADDFQDLAVDFQEYVGTILTECNRCRDIVQSLLTFSPRQNPEFTRVDLNRLVDDVLKLLQHRLRRYPTDAIRLALAAVSPQARGVAPELKQVVLNLVLNGLDAIRGGGHITLLTAQSGEEEVVLHVVDTGCGIAPEHMAKLFEPFFTTKPAGQGTGVGLSTCYNIIRQHGGEIRVASKLGRGSTFSVRLPRYR